MRAALLFTISAKCMSYFYAPKLTCSNSARYITHSPSLFRLIRGRNKVYLPGSRPHFFGGEKNPERTASCTYYSQARQSATSGNNRTEPYRIEMVNAKRRLLDVMVFRGFSMTPGEFICKLNHPIINELTHNRRRFENCAAMTEDHVVNLLMPDYDERGRYIGFRSKQTNYEQEVYFVAVYCSDCGLIPNGGVDDNANIDLALCERTNGVIGVVSAQQRDCSPSIRDSSDTDQQVANLEVHIPFPHVYLANMRVHESFRRMGVGRSLLSSVLEYAQSLSHDKHIQTGAHLPIVLSVDNDNTVAVSTYEKFGFVYLGKNNNFGTMVFSNQSALS
ncbi:hypothetical protein ACHAW6_015354 [Cyclotella cf. meneghiniana]